MITFENFFDYSKWANSKSLEHIMNFQPSEKIISLFSHILNAQHLWVNRILKKEPHYRVWQVHRKEEMQAIIDENYDHIAFLHSNFDGDEIIAYRNSKGQNFENRVNDILFHLFNHGNYHRAQLNQLWREMEVDPPYLDYIHWKRSADRSL